MGRTESVLPPSSLHGFLAPCPAFSIMVLWLSLVFYTDELGSITCGHPCLCLVDIEEEWLIFFSLVLASTLRS